MSSQIPLRVVTRYIELDAQLDTLLEEYQALKEMLRAYHAEGFISNKLHFRLATTQRPAWRTLVLELIEKYMTLAERKMYMRQINKRFPRKDVAPTIVILSKK